MGSVSVVVVRPAVIFLWASVSVDNSTSFRNSLWNRLLKLSMNPVCMGFPRALQCQSTVAH